MPDTEAPNTATPAPSATDLDELDRQVQRGSMFTQASLKVALDRLIRMEGLTRRLVTAMVEQGLVTPEELGLEVAEDDRPDDDDGGGESPDTAAPPESSTGESGAAAPAEPDHYPWPGITFAVEDPEADAAPPVQVDCAARMHVCHAACCTLKFALNESEVEAGVVKWDIGNPYVIRHESSGYCVHNDQSTGGCRVYADRPSVCRRYSCANDTRIWKDFDNMILNEEFIAENRSKNAIHMHRAVETEGIS